MLITEVRPLPYLPPSPLWTNTSVIPASDVFFLLHLATVCCHAWLCMLHSEHGSNYILIQTVHMQNMCELHNEMIVSWVEIFCRTNPIPEQATVQRITHFVGSTTLCSRPCRRSVELHYCNEPLFPREPNICKILVIFFSSVFYKAKRIMALSCLCFCVNLPDQTEWSIVIRSSMNIISF